jgi:hypothetical protein
MVIGALGLVGLLGACSSNASDGATSNTVGGGATGGSSAAGQGGSGGVAGRMSSAATGGAPGGAGSATGGAPGVAGSPVGSGGTSGASGTGTSGTTSANAGMPGSAGATMAGMAGGGSGATAGSGPTGNCHFTVTAQTADKMGQGGIPTVGVVDWSVDLASIGSASISFAPQGGTAALTAPVDVTKGPNFHTLLLGMKPSKTYSFRITADTCTSGDYMLTTGAVPMGLPAVKRTAGPSASAQAKGFIIASSGPGSLSAGAGSGNTNSYAYVIDADGDLVWWAPAPVSCSRAKMSYDGQYMWMAGLNVSNTKKDGGEVRRVSMDGLTSTGSIPGLANCHHDLTILPDGKIACLSWIQQSGDQPSDLLESDEKGTIKKVMTIDAKVYAGGQGLGGGTNTYHANAIHYHATDDSYTIGDRNPNLFIKVTRAGVLNWQFGGSCANAPAPQCVAGDWKVNHGHDMLDDGTFLIFNNGQSGASTALFYKLTESGSLAAMKTGQYQPGTSSMVLGDVQRLPNGNTLVAFSLAGTIQEIDPANALVQELSGSGAYIEWRATLYGPPPRF